MKRIMWLVLLGGALLAPFLLSIRTATADSARPFTLIQEETKTMGDVPVTNEVVTIAVNQDGLQSQRTERKFVSLGHTATLLRVVDPGLGHQTDYNPDLGLKSTTAVSRAAVATRYSSRANCPTPSNSIQPNAQFGATKTIQGIAVVPLATRSDLSDRVVIRQVLVAPSLGCTVLEEEIAVTGKTSSVSNASSKRSTRSISFGPPAQELFTIPDTTAEALPSTMDDLMRARLGGPVDCAECVERSKARADSIYFSHRPR